ncbi:MAG: hypothetical protein KFF73_06885 [Cyclobacteriaceae bacterium]|nr:hypothetical protein [Cyclobacteriaceae bacterium]
MNFLNIFAVFLLVISVSCQTVQNISIEDGTDEAGQSCFRITTPAATYFYQKEAGGFSGILDREGIDWIKFAPDSAESYPASATSSYRGLPNLVFGSDDGGAGHPGFRKCDSRKLSGNRIRSVSKSGKWQWTWTFKTDHAVLEMEKVDSSNPYWFLYEGTIAGRFAPGEQYWGADTGGPRFSRPDYFAGDPAYGHWQWLYTGDKRRDRIFFLAQKEPDELIDTFSYLGNNPDGIHAPDGMIVSGFGRGANATPLLRSENQSFIIGFIGKKILDEQDHIKLAAEIQRIISQ